MTCHDLAQLVAELHPDLSACEVAQLCLLVLRTADDAASLNPAAVDALIRAASFRLDAASDQHAAMTAELEAIFGEGPMRFSPDQIWTLLRAVKVQSQMLELYAGAPALTQDPAQEVGVRPAIVGRGPADSVDCIGLTERV